MTCVVSCAIKPLVVQLVTSIARGSGEKKSVVSVVVAEWGMGELECELSGAGPWCHVSFPSLPPFSKSLRSE